MCINNITSLRSPATYWAGIANNTKEQSVQPISVMFHSYISQRAIEHILEKRYRPLIKYIIGVLDILYTYVLEDVRNSELGEARVKRDVKHKLCTTIWIFKRMTVIFDQPASGIRQILSGLSKSNLNPLRSYWVSFLYSRAQIIVWN